MRITAVAVLVVAGLAGCGGSSPQQEIQATDRAIVAAVKTNRVGDACRLTTDQTKCLTTFATAHALGLKASDLLDGNEEQKVKTMKVTVRGDHARSQRGNEFVKRNGKWLAVWKG